MVDQEFKEYFLSLIDYQYCKIVNPIGLIKFYNKEVNYLMDYNPKNGWFWLSYPQVWSKLEFKFGYNNQQIKELTKGILEEHYKLKDITTYTI